MGGSGLGSQRQKKPSPLLSLGCIAAVFQLHVCIQSVDGPPLALIVYPSGSCVGRRNRIEGAPSALNGGGGELPCFNRSRSDAPTLQVYPDKGTVCFSAGLHGWGFTLSVFAKLYAKKVRLPGFRAFASSPRSNVCGWRLNC